MTVEKRTKVRGIQEMDNPERLRYFRVIDQLRGFGINEDLPLPQASCRLALWSVFSLTNVLDCCRWGPVQWKVFPT